jgi:cysteine synthase B
VTRYLKSRGVGVTCVSMQPDGPIHGLDGMKHMASAMVPAIYDATLADSTLSVATDDAYEMCRRLAKEEGVFVGPSSGANVTAALQVAREAAESATIVTVLPDGGSKYLSGELWRST